MGADAKQAAGDTSRAEFQELLQSVLTEVDADERAGSLLRATGMRVRFFFPDIDSTLNVAAGEEPDDHLQWTFSDDVSWSPKLELTMDSDVANRYLQGRESLAVAIARGRVRCRGESRIALLYLPALRLICDPYKRVVSSRFPHLAVA